MIVWFASVQNPDGAIPASPIFDHSLVLVDYNAYWIEGSTTTCSTRATRAAPAGVPNLVKLMNDLYPAHVGPTGSSSTGSAVRTTRSSRAAGPRSPTTTPSTSAHSAFAAAIATWDGDAADADRLAARASRRSAAAFGPAFWDPAAGAFSDTTASQRPRARRQRVRDPRRASTRPQARRRSTYLDRTMAQPGRPSPTARLGRLDWGDGDTQRVYPFISYFELLARYAAGADDSALELIRREWGSCSSDGPGTMWETIDERVAAPRPTAARRRPRLVERRGAGAHQLRARRPADVPRLRDVHCQPAPGRLAVGGGRRPTPHGDIQALLAGDAGRCSAGQISVTAPPGPPGRTPRRPLGAGEYGGAGISGAVHREAC